MQSESTEHSAPLLACNVVVGADVVVIFSMVVEVVLEGSVGCVVSSVLGRVAVVSVGPFMQPENKTETAIRTISIFFIAHHRLCTLMVVWV